MNYEQLQNALKLWSTPDDFYFEEREREVFVVDEEGFIHVITAVVFDPDDGCFHIRTRFKASKTNGEK